MESDYFQRVLEQEPLIRFSVYTAGQTRLLRELGNEILGLLDSGIDGSTVDGPSFVRAYGKFWLWVLGAYEVVRTMSQARSCFSPSAAESILAYKKRIAILRMPFAKQELAGGKGTITGEASVTGVDLADKDIHFNVEGNVVGARELILAFNDVIGGLTLENVLADHRSSHEHG